MMKGTVLMDNCMVVCINHRRDCFKVAHKLSNSTLLVGSTFDGSFSRGPLHCQNLDFY